jgi:nucleoside diphosphate kinase
MKKLNKKPPVINEIKENSAEIKFIFPMFIGYNKTLEQQSKFISESIITMKMLTRQNKVEKLRGLANDLKKHEASDFYSFNNKYEQKIKIVIQDEDINHSGYVDHNVCFNYQTDLEKNLKLSLIKIYYNIVVDFLIWKDDNELKTISGVLNKTDKSINLSILN